MSYTPPDNDAVDFGLWPLDPADNDAADFVLAPESIAASSGLAAASTTAGEADLSWTKNDSYSTGEWWIYRTTTSSPTFPDDFSRVAVLDDSAAESYTDTGLLDGEEYSYVVRRFVGGVAAETGVATATAVLPDVSAPTLTPLTGLRMEASWSDVTDNGDYRIQIREAGETSWDASAAGFAEAVVGHDTTDVVFEDLTAGQDYEVRLRSETEHVDGTWQTATATMDPPVTYVSGEASFLTPSGPVFSIASDARIVVEGPGDQQELRFVSAQIDLRHTAMSEFEIEVPYEPGEVEALADVFARVRFEYGGEIFFRGVIEASAATGGFGEANASLRGRGRGRFLWRGSPEEPYVVESERVDAALDGYIDTRTDFEPQIETDEGSTIATDQGAIDADATAEFEDTFTDGLDPDTVPFVARDGRLEAYDTTYIASAEDRDRHAGTPGQVISGSGFEGNGGGGDGQGYQFNDQHFGEATEDNYEQWIEIDFEVPYTISADHLQVALRYRGEQNASNLAVTYTLDGTEIGTFSPGTGGSVNWEEAALDRVSFDGDPGDVGPGTVTFRAEASLPTSDSGTLTFQFGSSTDTESLPDDDIEVLSETASVVGETSNLLNDDHPDVDGGDYTMDYPNGSITRVDGGDAPTGQDIEIEYEYVTDAEFVLDMAGFYDDRWDYDFPDSTQAGTDGGAYLVGPQKKPDGAQIVADAIDFTYTVERATVASTWRDDETDGNQAIEFSPDGGSTWVGESNATDFTQELVDEDALGTQLEVRLTLGRYGERDNGTPLTGFESQAVDVLDVTADLTSLAVIENQTFDADDFTNIQNMADQGDYRVVVDPASEERIVHGFKTGSSTQEADFDVISVDHENDNQGYANRVVVRGAEKPVAEQSYDGERYERSITDDDEVQTLVDEGLTESQATVTRPFTDPRLGSQPAVDRRAATRLAECVRIRSIKGDLDIVPTVVLPGYRYDVEAFDDELDLESVSFSLGQGEASGRVSFTEERSLAVDVSTLSLGVEANRQSL